MNWTQYAIITMEISPIDGGKRHLCIPNKTDKLITYVPRSRIFVCQTLGWSIELLPTVHEFRPIESHCCLEA